MDDKTSRNMKKYRKGNRGQSDETDEREPFPAYPAYPATDDIFYNLEEEDIDPDKIVEKSADTVDSDIDIDEDLTGLDIPGSELDDPEEIIGSEDEENNYYSLGGDDHENLEEHE